VISRQLLSRRVLFDGSLINNRLCRITHSLQVTQPMVFSRQRPQAPGHSRSLLLLVVLPGIRLYRSNRSVSATDNSKRNTWEFKANSYAMDT
jgi:hypothetical protein